MPHAFELTHLCALVNKKCTQLRLLKHFQSKQIRSGEVENLPLAPSHVCAQTQQPSVHVSEFPFHQGDRGAPLPAVSPLQRLTNESSAWNTACSSHNQTMTIKTVRHAEGRWLQSVVIKLDFLWKNVDYLENF